MTGHTPFLVQDPFLRVVRNRFVQISFVSCPASTCDCSPPDGALFYRRFYRSVRPAWVFVWGGCRVMAFCFTFILDEDLSASSERDWETFISLDGRDAVLGPHRDCTPVMRKRVRIDSSSPHRMPAGFFTRTPTRVPLLRTLQISRLFRYSRRFQRDFDTIP